MRISTGAALLSVLSADHATDKAMRKGLRKRSTTLMNVLGLGLAVGGPLIAKLIEFLRGTKDLKEKEEEKAVLEAQAVVTPLNLPAHNASVKDVPTPPQAKKATLVNSGKKVSRQGVLDAIKGASAKYGQDYATMYAIAGAESSFRTNAKADTSSASGLFQFTKGTWKYLNSIYPDLGYDDDDRNDPHKAATMAALYIKSLKASLQRLLGREPTVREIYLAYFLGPSGAAAFFGALKSKPKAKAADLFPAQAKANVMLFYDGGDTDKPLSMEQVFERIGGKVERFYAEVPKDAGGGTTVTLNTPTQATTSPVKVSMPSVQPTPVPQTVSAPSLPTATEIKQAQGDTSVQTAQANIPDAGQSSKRSMPQSFFRDKHGRLVALSG